MFKIAWKNINNKLDLVTVKDGETYIFGDYSRNNILKKKYGTYVQYIKAILDFDNSNPLATTEEIERITKELY